MWIVRPLPVTGRKGGNFNRLHLVAVVTRPLRQIVDGPLVRGRRGGCAWPGGGRVEHKLLMRLDRRTCNDHSGQQDRNKQETEGGG